MITTSEGFIILLPSFVIGNSEYTTFGNLECSKNGNKECSIIGTNQYIVHLLGRGVPKEKTSFVGAKDKVIYELLFK